MEEPKATSKHTLCGYAWGDVTSSLQRAISVEDMTRSQRWAAELVCSDLGLGRLEALLFHIWALHVGSSYPSWCKTWFLAIHTLRSLWTKSGGDIKAVRNTPIVRQLVAESVAYLVLATKHPLPAIPTDKDCYREADAMRQRIRSGGGAPDQIATRRIWVQQLDGEDLRTIGNELEVAIKTNQLHRTLFWIVWMFTLEAQENAPTAKERGPAFLSVKQRKSILWFLVHLLKELANDAAYLPIDDRKAIFDTLELTWPKLGIRGRKDCIVAVALAIQEHITKQQSIVLSRPSSTPDLEKIRDVVAKIDNVYAGIAEEARKYVLEAPVIAGLTKDVPKRPANQKLTAVDKLSLSYSLLGSKPI